ncbi:hypothetical protein ACHAPT_006161 [Fusarium lateritium]
MAQYEAVRNPGVIPQRPESPQPDFDHPESTLSSHASYEAIPNPDEPPLESNNNTNPTIGDSDTSISKHTSQRWRNKIGFFSLFTILAGTLAILSSCSILIFIWRGAELAKDRNEPKFWQTIVSRGWVPSVVTVCSAIIRTSITLQIGVVAAAVAALILERSGASLVDTATLSIERAIMSSPLNIVTIAMKRSVAGGARGFLYFLLIAATIIIAVISTFISTILLSDFRMTTIVGPPTTQNISFNYDTVQFSTGASYWKARPSANWRFAEAKVGKPLAAKGDTGSIYRAFLPIPNETARASLERYVGPAVVVNSRTVCGGPNINELQFIKFSTESQKTVQDRVSRQLGGLHLDVDSPCDLDNLGIEWPRCRLRFNCKVPNSWDPKTSSWPINLCNNQNGSYRSYDPMDPLSREPLELHAVTLLNGSTSLVTNNFTAMGDILGDSKLTEDGDGVWSKFRLPNGTQVLSFTTCFVNLAPPKVYNVTMAGRSILSEPVVDWHRRTNQAKVKSIQSQLGADTRPRNLEERGILALHVETDSRGHANNVSADSLFVASILKNVTEDAPGGSPNSWSMIDEPGIAYSDLGVEMAHAAHASLFQSILQETHDPALAVQALFTRMQQMIYYDSLNDFNVSGPVMTVYSTETLIPARWTGLILTITLTVVHFSVLLIAVVLFVLQTSGSVLGETWQVVAQMVSPQTREVLEMADSVRDKDVKEWAKAAGQEGRVYHMAQSNTSGRREVQEREM